MRSGILSHVWPFILALTIVMGWMAYGKVVWFEKGEVVNHTHGRLQMKVSAYKLRDCEIVPNSQLGYVHSAGGLWEEAEIRFIRDITPNSSKPRLFQRQSFGTWEWSFYPNKLAKSVLVTVIHRCKYLSESNNLRLTRIGPMDVK